MSWRIQYRWAALGAINSSQPTLCQWTCLPLVGKKHCQVSRTAPDTNRNTGRTQWLPQRGNQLLTPGKMRPLFKFLFWSTYRPRKLQRYYWEVLYTLGPASPRDYNSVTMVWWQIQDTDTVTSCKWFYPAQYLNWRSWQSEDEIQAQMTTAGRQTRLMSNTNQV